MSTDKKTGFPRYLPVAPARIYIRTWEMDLRALFGIPPEDDIFYFFHAEG